MQKINLKSKKSKITISCIVLFLVFCFGVSAGSTDVKTSSEYVKLEEQYNSIVKEKDELNEKIKSAEQYLSLNDSEKSLIDAEIENAKKATEEENKKREEELAKKKAEEEAKKKAEEEAKKKAEEEAKAQKEAEEKAAKEAAEQAAREAEAHKYETGLTWEDIARDQHTGEYCQFSGKVIQVMNGDTFNQYRIAIDDNYDQIMLIQINLPLSSGTVLENDYISFKGISVGTMSYQTVLGAQMTVPAVQVDEYSIN